MHRHPLPSELQVRRTEAEKYARALLPGASRVDYIDHLATTVMRWHIFQVYCDGQYGVIHYDNRTDRFALEFPFKLLLADFNAEVVDKQIS